MDSAALATIVAAVATTVSAATIAWQAVETRKSADATTRAANASEEALKVANNSLEISRNQSHQAQFMAIEAMRTRLDEWSPSVSMTLTASQYLVGNPHLDSNVVAIPFGTVLQTETSEWLYVAYKAWVTNHGSTPVTLRAKQAFHKPNGLGGTLIYKDVELPVGPSLHYIVAGDSVERWVEVEDSNSHAAWGLGGWSTVPDARQGVALSQDFKVIGSIITPAGEGKYELKGLDVRDGAYSAHSKVTRLYYIDEGRLLPSPDPEGPPPTTP